MADFGRDICSDLRFASLREWLVTNGLGGFASGTVSGVLTRRYHGLLVAALDPPLGRTLLVAQTDETVDYEDRSFRLATHRWTSGISPSGHVHLDRFRLEGQMPVWTFACGDALLEKRVWMAEKENTTWVRYALLRGRTPVNLHVKVLVNYRDYHGTTRADGWTMDVEDVPDGLRIQGFEGAEPIYLRSGDGEADAAHEWYRDFELAREADRGLDHTEDHLHAGTFELTIEPGEAASTVLSTEAAADLDGQAALRAERDRVARIGDRAIEERTSSDGGMLPDHPPAEIAALVGAADQFVVARPTEEDPRGESVIAGYPWFGDWGRDTMIALPGLTLTTGRPEVAAHILRTFGRNVDRGMLPNRFPDVGDTPEYNTIDATFWYVEAIRAYHAATGDEELLEGLYPVLTEIIDWHESGTRYQIHVDPEDGLVYGGEPGVQLTWMDAKVGDWVVTPRIGKPVEVNALWYNALRILASFADRLGEDSVPFTEKADRVRDSFDRFWSEELGYLNDVLDGPDGEETLLRPNQIFAVSLPHSPLSAEKQREVVDVCAARLLTPHGLRSLAPEENDYVGRYEGGPRQRDGAYHQGTVWAWLIGPFVRAHLRVYDDPDLARSFLRPLLRQLTDHGVGQLSEIYDGDAPFRPHGATAQAWSVGQVLEAWVATNEE